MDATLPVLQVRGNSVLLYREAIFSRRYANNFMARRRMKEAKKQQYSGQLKDGARKRMVKAITLMCQATRPRWVRTGRGNSESYHHISFLTLTIPGNKQLSPSDGYNLVFKHFLQWLRRTKEVKMYVCVVERQVRGQLHYHLVFPDYIPHREIRDEWNSLLRKAGFLDEYAAEHGHYNAPSSHINGVKKTNDVAGYLVKELSKKMQKNLKGSQEDSSEENTANDKKKTAGKVWYCSECFAGAKYFSVIMSFEHQAYLDELRKRGEVLKEINEDFWCLITFDAKSGKAPPDLLSAREKEMFHEHLDSICNKKDPDLFAEPIIETIADVQSDRAWKPVQACIDLFNN